jgi:DNA-binding LacI/PurR family transcriptional regulator
LDLSSELPLYESIKREFKSRIESGELAEGTRILPEIELAKQVGVSRSTARKALQGLEMEGYITRTAGRGSFVKAPRRDDANAVQAGRGTLAITLPQIERFNHAGQIVQGFLNSALSNGFHAVMHPPISPVMDEFEYLVNVRRSGIDGWALWLVNPSEKNINLLRNFQRSGCALVLIDRFVRTLESDFVVTKNEEMAYTLTRELIRRGHRQVGIITFPGDSTFTQDRFNGYRRAIEEAGFTYNDELAIIDEIQGLDPLRLQILGLLGRRERPTAIFCGTEHHARLLVGELGRLGYSVPDDLEVAMVDDNRYGSELDIPILIATQRSYEMGRRAAALLQRRIEFPDSDWQQVFLDFDLNFTPAH